MYRLVSSHSLHHPVPAAMESVLWILEKHIVTIANPKDIFGDVHKSRLLHSA